MSVAKILGMLAHLGITEKMLHGKNLANLLGSELDQFVITAQEYFVEEEIFMVKLYFQRPAGYDFQFYKYECGSIHRVAPDRSIGVTQTFHVIEYAPTMSVARNLLQGRSVLVSKGRYAEDVDEGGTWIQLDIGNFDQRGNNKIIRQCSGNRYPLERVFEKYEFIVELQHPETRQQIKQSLEQGNKEPVTLLTSRGVRENRFIEANPHIGLLRISNPPKPKKQSDMANIAHIDPDKILWLNGGKDRHGSGYNREENEEHREEKVDPRDEIDNDREEFSNHREEFGNNRERPDDHHEEPANRA